MTALPGDDLAARSPRWVRRLITVAVLALILPLTGCGPDPGAATGSAGSEAATGGASPGSGSGSASGSGSGSSAEPGAITVGGADFTEMAIMEALYGQLLTKAGFDIRYQTSSSREAYLKQLEAGLVDVVPDYAATTTEFLNRQLNGSRATLVASADPAATVAELGSLARRRGLAVLAPAQAADENGFAVRADYAAQHRLTTLSQLAALGRPVVLAGSPDCAQSPFCAPGLTRAYGLTFSSVLPLGFGSGAAKQAVLDGRATLVLVATTDGTLGRLGLRVLTDDRQLQLADNLVPVLNSATARDHRVAAALNPLAAVLTTADLAAMNQQVDGAREFPEQVAHDYLRSRKLL